MTYFQHTLKITSEPGWLIIVLKDALSAGSIASIEMSPVPTFPNTQTWNITNACATWDGQASKHPGAHRLVKVSYDMNHIDRGRVFSQGGET